MATPAAKKLSTQETNNLVSQLQKDFKYNDTQIKDYFSKNNLSWQQEKTQPVQTTTVKLQSGATSELTPSQLALREKNMKTQWLDPNTTKAGQTGGAIQVSSLSDAKTVDQINQYFNTKQVTEFENRNLPENNTSPSIPTFEDYKKTYWTALTGNTKAPELYSSVETLDTLRTQYGISDLETRMNELEAQKAELIAQSRQRTQAQEGKAVPMGVIWGRVSEIERQDSERMDVINRELNSIANQYNTKMNVISQYMKYTGEDYDRANQRFETEYKRNLDMLNMYRDDVKMMKDDASEEEKVAYQRSRDAQNDAKATLQTLYNSTASGALDYDSMDDAQKMLIAKLEVQSGFPAGTIAQIKNNNPKSDIVTQSVVETADGKQVLNLVLRDKNTGAMTTQNIVMWQASLDKSRYQYKDNGDVFDSATGVVRDAGSLDAMDFRSLAYKYPNEASLKNNNPAGITWNDTFATTLERNGIKYEKGTARPKNEWGNYFSFPNVAEGMKAYDLLWSMPSYQNLTVQQALNRWGTGAINANIDKTKKISDLSEGEIQQLQMAQLKKESPGFYKELQNAQTKKSDPKADKQEVDNFYKDLDSYRTKVYDGEVSIDQALSYLNTKYPGASEGHIAWMKSQLGE